MRFEFSLGGQIREIKNIAKKYYYNSATQGKVKFANFKLRGKSQNQKIAKICTRENYQIYSIC